MGPPRPLTFILFWMYEYPRKKRNAAKRWAGPSSRRGRGGGRAPVTSVFFSQKRTKWPHCACPGAAQVLMAACERGNMALVERLVGAAQLVLDKDKLTPVDVDDPSTFPNNQLVRSDLTRTYTTVPRCPALLTHKPLPPSSRARRTGAHPLARTQARPRPGWPAPPFPLACARARHLQWVECSSK